MADTTLPGLLAVGNHASRPAVGDVGSGALYSCTDHDLIYQSDGSTWSTWATMSVGAAVLDDLADVLAPTPADGNVLTWDDYLSQWVPAAASGGGDLSDQGAFTFLDATEAAAPATPASGYARIYAKTDGRIYSKDDAGTEYGPFDAAGGGAGSDYIATITAETGITAYWPLNEGTGTTYADAIGTLDMTALATTPGFGPILNGDWTNGGSLVIPSATYRVGCAALTWGATFTYEAWVCLTHFAVGALVAQWDGAGSMILLASTTAMRAYSGASYATWTCSVPEIFGVHHVAVTHDGTDIRLYWDGVEKASATLAVPATNVGGSMRVGAYNNSAAGTGLIASDVAFYSGRCFTAGELLAHYQLGAGL